MGGMAQVGKLLRQDGADNRVSALFYREAIQVVLIFGLDFWELSYTMMREVESTHVVLIYHITGKRSRRQSGGLW